MDDLSERQLSAFDQSISLILAVSYPTLAISTGFRAVYQLFFKDGVDNYLAPSLSGLAAISYLLATIGFAYRKKWAWKLSVGSLGFETLMTVVVGILSFIIPETIGSTVWRHFGADYAWFPLIQPILGLIWLFRKETLYVYGFVDKRE